MTDDPPHELPGRRLPKGLREFLHTEAAGGVVLLLGAVVALVWANSPWSDGYEELWHTEVLLRVGGWELSEDLRHWVNDGLMAVFFFVVGLEIKRELVAGELRSPRTAAFPAMAALGGMVLPAGLYLLLNAGQAGASGWGIPMATDIAFAVGVVAVVARGVSGSLKLFLLTLAVVDDIGAIAVIAIFYSQGVDGVALLVAVGLFALVVVLRVLKVRWTPIFFVVGAAAWLATLQSGVHATIAGVILGLLTPARPLAPADLAREWADDLSDDPEPDRLRAMTAAARASVSEAERLQHKLHPITSFFIVPVFALANAGVALESGALDASGATMVAVGVAVGLVVGKIVGITSFAWLSVRLGLGQLPAGSTWPQVVGMAAVAGIGFTVSLFIAGLAFAGQGGGAELEDAAKLGILGGSLLAAVLGTLLLRMGTPNPDGSGGGAAH